jgi:hypothetical protein
MTSCPFEKNITWDNINAILKMAAPYRDPKGIRTVVLESLVPATTAVIMSGAPLASARKVMPAMA